jgi:hypothetical protein
LQRRFFWFPELMLAEMKSWVGVVSMHIATVGVDLSASFLLAFRWSFAQKYHLVSASQRVLSRLSSWVRMCHVIYHPEHHVSLNIIEKLCLNPKSSPWLRLKIYFGFVTSAVVVFSPEWKRFASEPFFSWA